MSRRKRAGECDTDRCSTRLVTRRSWIGCESGLRPGRYHLLDPHLAATGQVAGRSHSGALSPSRQKGGVAATTGAKGDSQPHRLPAVTNLTARRAKDRSIVGGRNPFISRRAVEGSSSHPSSWLWGAMDAALFSTQQPPLTRPCVSAIASALGAIFGIQASTTRPTKRSPHRVNFDYYLHHP